MKMSLPAPRNVSPLIRASRWAALGVGIVYGASRYNSLASKEVKIQEAENVVKEQRRARLAAEKEAKAKVEMDALGKEAGVLK